MIRSAVLKLTFAYLAMIMALSVAFSVTLYKISDAELNHGLRKPGQPVFRETSLYDFDMFREARLNESRAALKSNLVMLNIVTLAAGAAASYLLARKTLEPIAAAMESQARFTADASHELRTPLTAMQTEIEVALRDKSLVVQDARELLESNLEEVVKLRNLSDGLLRLARPNGEKLTATKVEIYDATVRAIENTAKQSQANDMQIINRVPKGILAKGESESLAEVMTILIDNAIKYSDSGKKIIISASEEQGQILIRVKDSGIGIHIDDIPHVFDRFYRADASRVKVDAGGYGLGLSIAKKIIDLHDGYIGIEGTSDKGTTFVIKLHKYIS